ncbi:MAG: hypothetical protein KDB27_30170, partial [Planctomycetales bacterium]|nr:hypothetical protein [Planctomycetales bacterium]
MDAKVDHAAFEFGFAMPTVRPDLAFTVHTTGSTNQQARWYVIEDEANGRFFRVGHAEYIFLSLLDGKTTVQKAIALTAADLGASAFTEHEAANLCRWLVENGLAEKSRHDSSRWNDIQSRRRIARRARWVNPIMLRVPLGNPDRVIQLATAMFGWAVSWPIAIATFSLWAIAIIVLTPRFDELLQRTPFIWSATNWICFCLCWLLLRIIHETAHAITCKRCGGSVREWGILFLMFVPLPYVDVTSAWRFPERSARVLTSAAGMLAELTVAAIAALVWCYADDDFVRQNAINVMFAASFTTILFNANPLMRFDGYHIAADSINAPNLWTHGRAYVRSVGRKYFFGLSSQERSWNPKHRWLVKAYGWASLCWTVFICMSLTLTAFSLVEGIGLALAAISLTLWLGVPIYRLAVFLRRGTEFEQPNHWRFMRVSLLSFAVVGLLGAILPAPATINAPTIIQHNPLVTVRAHNAGFIREFLVSPGDTVRAGDVICQLQNIDLEMELCQITLQQKASEQRLRAFVSNGDPAAAQQEAETVEDLAHKRDELQSRIEQLTVRSPILGRILDDDLDERLGCYVTRGSEIVSVGSSERKKAVALVSQADAQHLAEVHNYPVDIRLWGTYRELFSGYIANVNPRTQASLPHAAFAAPYGGPLAVIANDPRHIHNRGDKSLGPKTEWQLVEPRISVEIELDYVASANTHVGQTGVAYIRLRHESLGRYVVSEFTRY